jgi:hypothetical protein
LVMPEFLNLRTSSICSTVKRICCCGGGWEEEEEGGGEEEEVEPFWDGIV